MCCYSSNFSSNFFHPLWKKLLPNMDWPNLTPGPNPRYLLFFVDFEIQGQFMVVIRSVLVDLKSNHGPELDFGFSLMEFPSFDSKFWTSAKSGVFWVPILVRPGVALSGLEWPGAAWSGLEWPGAAWSGLEQPGAAWSGLEWPGVMLIWHQRHVDFHQHHVDFHQHGCLVYYNLS